MALHSPRHGPRHFKEASPETTFLASSTAVVSRCLKGKGSTKVPSAKLLSNQAATSLSSNALSPLAGAEDSTILGLTDEGPRKAYCRP